ncbi:MAG: hypothetical protein BGP05_08890 [Rhizobiales bacterium 62-47]|nr:hypothetical protein [Hyphomicrobiales bacterium]OJY14020.1 MAG: hypothetical protein BGP05_08890 [Rhizobiales bacterium 62-47]
MLRPTMLAALLVATTGTASFAADLPAQTRLGKIFAEPAPSPVPPLAYQTDTSAWITESVFAPEVDVPSLVNGYYGKPRSYLYRSYYGTPPDLIFGRLPYACGYYGYC